uniref:HDC13475 n=1 Tax=Drosophila melanogaster TaxID=7227 RepID=Q6IK33_DROME|nr:TPA_inf: HDC13475 [Drosophila melanogaster]
MAHPLAVRSSGIIIIITIIIGGGGATILPHDRAQLQHNFQTSTRQSSNFGGALATLSGHQIKSISWTPRLSFTPSSDLAAGKRFVFSQSAFNEFQFNMLGHMQSKPGYLTTVRCVFVDNAALCDLQLQSLSKTPMRVAAAQSEKRQQQHEQHLRLAVRLGFLVWPVTASSSPSPCPSPSPSPGPSQSRRSRGFREESLLVELTSLAEHSSPSQYIFQKEFRK